MRSDDAQRDTARGKFVVQLMQHVRASEIEIGRCRQVTNHRSDIRRSGCTDPRQDGSQDRVGIHIDERGFRTGRNDAG